MLKKITILFLIQTLASFAVAKKPNVIVFLVDDFGAMDIQLPIFRSPLIYQQLKIF